MILLLRGRPATERRFVAEHRICQVGQMRKLQNVIGRFQRKTDKLARFRCKAGSLFHLCMDEAEIRFGHAVF